jgi:Cu(I)/Ag(I) efflux system membrane fusion protein
MRRHLLNTMFLVAGLILGTAGTYWYVRLSSSALSLPLSSAATAAADNRQILYYRDPTGAPYWSAEPKRDARGREYLPVYEDEEPSFGPGGELKETAIPKPGPRRILYYRNPMGLPDTSPVPKKDWMGMDYIAVYEGDEPDDGKTVRVSLDKTQRTGVRTEVVEERTIVRPVRAVGTVMRDEARVTIVAMRSDGYIEELFVSKTGQHVRMGDPLFRVYSPDIVSAQVNLRISSGIIGGEQRLRNLGVPESHIREVVAGKNPMSLVWPAPATGDVIEKKVINGQRVKAGDELYRIADHSQLWVIADVAESDLPAIKVGTHATVMVRAYMAEPIEGTVTFIYPELKTETRTARIRIEVPNPDGRFKVDMYADVMFETGAAPGAPVFVGASGALTQAPPTPPGSAFLLRIGAATAANALHVNPSPPLAF